MSTFGELRWVLVGRTMRSPLAISAGVALVAMTSGCPDSNRADLDGGADASPDVAAADRATDTANP